MSHGAATDPPPSPYPCSVCHGARVVPEHAPTCDGDGNTCDDCPVEIDCPECTVAPRPFASFPFVLGPDTDDDVPF